MLPQILVASLSVSDSLTCGNVKSFFKSSQCCNHPDKAIAAPCDKVKFGDTSFEGKYVAFEAKDEKKWHSCIDSTHCSTWKSFRDNEFQYYTMGDRSAAPSEAGTYPGQLYPYISTMTYHHGNTSFLESSMSQEIRSKYGSPLYTAPSRMLHAMVFAQMFNSKKVLQNVFMTHADPISRFVPALKLDAETKKPLRKFDWLTKTQGTFSYADVNFYRWLHIGTAGAAGGKCTATCVYSQLPNGATAVIEDGLASSVTSLDQVPLTKGVLQVASNPTETFDVSSLHLDALDELWGIDKDPLLTGTDDTLAAKGGIDHYTNDASYGLTLRLPVGNIALEDGPFKRIDGYDFLVQVVQFKIVPQTKEITMRDVLSGRTGFDSPTTVAVKLHVNYPNRYLSRALYSFFMTNALYDLRYSNNALDIVDVIATDQQLTDEEYLELHTRIPLVAQPGTKYTTGGVHLITYALAAIEEAVTHPHKFPKDSKGEYVFDAIDFSKLSVSFAQLAKKYVFDPVQIPADAYAFGGAHMQQGDAWRRIVPNYNAELAHIFTAGSPSLAEISSSLQNASGITNWEMKPDEVDRVYSYHDVWSASNEYYDKLGYLDDVNKAPYGLRSAIATAKWSFDGLVAAKCAPGDGYNILHCDPIMHEKSYMLKDLYPITSRYAFITIEAASALMEVMNNKGKTKQGVRAMPCSTVRLLEVPLEWRESDIDDISTYREPPSAQNDGKVVSTMGGFMAHEPDFLTVRNALTLEGPTYEQGGCVLAVGRSDQFYDIVLSGTSSLGPSWTVEDRWPGATFIREKYEMLRYNSRLCMPFD